MLTRKHHWRIIESRCPLGTDSFDQGRQLCCLSHSKEDEKFCRNPPQVDQRTFARFYTKRYLVISDTHLICCATEVALHMTNHCILCDMRLVTKERGTGGRIKNGPEPLPLSDVLHEAHFNDSVRRNPQIRNLRPSIVSDPQEDAQQHFSENTRIGPDFHLLFSDDVEHAVAVGCF